ncbi:MAG: hypothetical protein OXS35_10025 [Dehalococcoidia bacterium]|nr:hypothetical protein [Dehalococcoidia bacterium]
MVEYAMTLGYSAMLLRLDLAIAKALAPLAGKLGEIDGAILEGRPDGIVLTPC